MCRSFRDIRGYDKHKITEFELSFPLAFVILVDQELEQFERFLRTIYRSHNVYCIHVDKKASREFKEGIESIVDCFDNVFIPTKTGNVIWGAYTLLEAQLSCMSDLLNMNKRINEDKHPRLESKKPVEWKYLVNAASTFLPLRTNLELTRIFEMYNGSVDVSLVKSINEWRYKYRWSYEYNQRAFYTYWEKKASVPFNFTVVKCSNYMAASRLFVDYILNSKQGKELAEWSVDMYIPVIK
jgi:hypothetical protein